jgi:hypothetical protein
MKPVPIGKGLFRITVRSKAKLDRLAKIRGVQIDGSRVIFPGWLLNHVRDILEPQHRGPSKKPDQENLFE